MTVTMDEETKLKLNKIYIDISMYETEANEVQQRIGLGDLIDFLCKTISSK